MSQKLKTSLGLFSLLPIVVPLAWVSVSLASNSDLDVDAAVNVDADYSEPPVELGPINVHLQDALYRAGLDPEALAAAGITPSQVGAMCEALREDIVMVQPILDGADAGVASARTDVGRLGRLVRSGKGSPEDVASLAQRKTDCDAALAERENCMNHFHEAACAGLTEAQRTALRNIRKNRKWKAPVPYLVVNRSPEEWMALEENLDIERIETRWGLEVPEETVSVACRDSLKREDCERAEPHSTPTSPH